MDPRSVASLKPYLRSLVLSTNLGSSELDTVLGYLRSSKAFDVRVWFEDFRTFRGGVLKGGRAKLTDHVKFGLRISSSGITRLGT